MRRTSMYMLSIAAISFILLFAGCGQSGPLYIPGDPSKIAVPATEGSEKDEQSGDSTESE